MNYIECSEVDYKLLFKKMTPADVKIYMFETLKVLLIY